uniref:Acid phosphatase n=1 Tax=Acrobeloides nanus TaxID=290746 RepID=A0A914EPW2_9BILA
MQEHYIQGVKLRQRYMIDYPFLNRTYKASDLYVLSDDMNRCLVSAAANLAGFYAQSVNTYPNLPGWPSNWSPVPIHTVDLSTDHLFNYGTCPRSIVLEGERILKQGFLQYFIQEMPLLMNISQNAGFNFLQINDYIHFIDCMITERFNNYTLPSWITDSIYNQGVKLASTVLDYIYGSALLGEDEDTEQLMLRGGPLLKEIITNMQNANHGQRSHLYYAYSGHDTTLAALLRVLGAKENVLGDTQPAFASTIVFELWKMSDGSNQVQIAYSDDADTPFRDITQFISGCPLNNICPFETFLNRSQPYLPTDISQQCLNLNG